LLNWVYSLIPGKPGSKYNFTAINADFRGYRPISKRDVLALHLTGNFSTGNVPFNQLALMGGEIMMRGYYYGRYRDKNMVAGQAEYRILPFSFSKRIGAVVFAGTAVVAPSIGSLRFDNLKIAAGAGLRYLLFLKKIFLCDWM
jgi:outer membrane protein assembly factor BamA